LTEVNRNDRLDLQLVDVVKVDVSFVKVTRSLFSAYTLWFLYLTDLHARCHATMVGLARIVAIIQRKRLTTNAIQNVQERRLVHLVKV
jgi:hypothetical protein